jgi:uncharacterized protein YdeI (YjbR/CyaY-like superfamily)
MEFFRNFQRTALSKQFAQSNHPVEKLAQRTLATCGGFAADCAVRFSKSAIFIKSSPTAMVTVSEKTVAVV